MTSKELIAKYLQSRGQYAQASFGHVTVIVEKLFPNEKPGVSINWPGIGAVSSLKALEFASSLTEAALVAVGCENIISDWSTDQWREPEDR